MYIIGFIGGDQLDLIYLLTEKFACKGKRILMIDHNEEESLTNSLTRPVCLSADKDIISYRSFDFTEKAAQQEWAKRYDLILIDYGRMGMMSDSCLCTHLICVTDMMLQHAVMMKRAYAKVTKRADVQVYALLRDIVGCRSYVKYVKEYIKEALLTEQIDLLWQDEKDSENRIRCLLTGKCTERAASQGMRNYMKELLERLANGEQR